MWVFCRGYPLVNVTCLSATLPLVNCPDYYCDNVAIKKEAHHENGVEGLMVREMDVHRLQGSGKCIKVAIHSDPPLPLPSPSSSKAAGYYRPSSLISISNQYSSAAVKIAVNQRAASERSGAQEGKSKGGP